jgi:hypothetical protein
LNKEEVKMEYDEKNGILSILGEKKHERWKTTNYNEEEHRNKIKKCIQLKFNIFFFKNQNKTRIGNFANSTLYCSKT